MAANIVTIDGEFEPGKPASGSLYKDISEFGSEIIYMVAQQKDGSPCLISLEDGIQYTWDEETLFGGDEGDFVLIPAGTELKIVAG